jgi:hypothetical protein
MSTIRFAQNVGLDLGADGKMTVQWDNGHAYDMVKGATVSYIPKHMYAHFVFSGENTIKEYSPGSDFDAMTAAGVTMQNAIAVVFVRLVMTSIKDIRFNAAEVEKVKEVKKELGTNADISKLIKDNQQALSNLTQQGLTILALNGIQMISSGHHYVDTSGMWSRFAAATSFDDTVAKLKLTNHEGLLFHDAGHFIDIDWLAAQVASENSVFVGHVNGVASTRLPAVPAGTTLVGVLLAMIDDCKIVNPKIASMFTPFAEIAHELQKMIRASPLDYCAQFQRTNTSSNLKKLDRLVKPACILFGYLNKAMTRKSTALKAKSLQTAASRNASYTEMGGRLADAQPAVELTLETIAETLKELAA